MSHLGHQRRFERAPATSALPPIPDVLLSRANDIQGQEGTPGPSQSWLEYYRGGLNSRVVRSLVDAIRHLTRVAQEVPTSQNPQRV